MIAAAAAGIFGGLKKPLSAVGQIPPMAGGSLPLDTLAGS
jgi:hypothetical protein